MQKTNATAFTLGDILDCLMRPEHLTERNIATVLHGDPEAVRDGFMVLSGAQLVKLEDTRIAGEHEHKTWRLTLTDADEIDRRAREHGVDLLALHDG